MRCGQMIASVSAEDHPIELPVAGRVFAEEGEASLVPGTALAIMTGAPVPRGADAVIPHERTERHGDSVRIFAPVEPGDCVFPPGEDFRRGDELISPGDILNPGSWHSWLSREKLQRVYTGVRGSPLFASRQC